jgi:hypothetical protein
MLIINSLMTVLAFGLLAFGYWGTATEAGQRRYDEMAGMIPYASWYLGLALAGFIGLRIAYIIWLNR